MANLIHVNGTIEEVTPKNGNDFSLDEMTEMLECDLIQIADGKDGTILVFDEEFMMRNDWLKRINKKATEAMHTKMGPFVHNIISGKALHCKSEEVK